MVGQNYEIIDPTGRVWINTVVVACRDWLDCHGHDSGRYNYQEEPSESNPEHQETKFPQNEEGTPRGSNRGCEILAIPIPG